MNDRDRVFQTMDTIRSVLERLPEAAVQHLRVEADVEKPCIQFFRDTFPHVLAAFPFTNPTRKPHNDNTGHYDVEEFMVDGVLLFHLVAKEDEESNEQGNGAGKAPGTGPDGEAPEEAGVEKERLAG